MASGAWESITIKGRRFTCKADDDVNYHLSGGFENEVLVQGDGTMQQKKLVFQVLFRESTSTLMTAVMTWNSLKNARTLWTSSR